ncbi:uncharacterized protein LOC123526246 [Mercenaria mercenaria]|uniref:uncharacterized protein LOC123526246 n=1 Tax=Mercenaria mercenaria TaxID=6596 RepID=UPI00234F7DD0|nr:uncharacterized protein LOC123526246 [Mercenaria mercenaria]XP_053378861.1 uncharacterized protein LOC123526246 [Mercenaria mercenaria]XP_053378862.1 uncharacterized protein LOC123526246 [Mercenaria mercenaria]
MMAHYKSRLSKQTFSEYLKLGLALQITKEGLQGVVETETVEFHCMILQEIRRKPLCSECRIENVLECPTVGLCKRKQCPFHSSSLKQPRQCPNGTCNIFRDRVKEAFRYVAEPAWRNTDAQQWSKNAFQLTKCFLPPETYEDVNSIEDVDLYGLIRVILNNKRYDEKISEDLSREETTISQVLKIEKTYRNSDSLTVSDKEVFDYINLMIHVLTDSKLKHDHKAKEALSKLKQLKADTLQTSTPTIVAILTDAIQSAIKGNGLKKRQIGKSKRSNYQDTAVNKLKLNVLNGCRDIFSRENRKIKTSQLEAFVSEKRLAITELKETVKKLHESQEKENLKKATAVPLRKPSENETDDFNMNDSERVTANVRRLSLPSSSFVNESYKQLKSELKRDLILFYRERHSTLPLSPLIQKNKAPLLDFYVPPAITVVGLDKGLFDEKEYPMYKDVSSLEDIFVKTKGKDLYRNICLTSPPGTGKTSFAKHMALAWCQAHNPEKAHDTYFSKTDQEFMRLFEFLFLISLRDARQECDQDAMIKTLVLSQLDQNHLYTDTLLQDVLHKERCLVLMDGLDEWRHPKPASKFCELGKSDFPHTKVRPVCTTLTTSRPWTLNSVRNCGADIDQRLEIQGLGKESSKRLVCKVLAYLNKKNVHKQNTSDETFFNMLSSKGLQKFESNPVILMQLLCLWYEGTDLGESQCEIYSNMLELLFRRAECTKHFRTKGKQTMKLPNCFARNPLCKKSAKLLLSLGKLAFATLFRGKGESVYVFDRAVAREQLQDQDVQKCLEVGILSQSEEQGKITSENIKLSFLHKTFQEFFAALSIASKNKMTKDDEKCMFEKHDSVRDLLQLDVILVFLSGFAPRITSGLTKQTSEIVANDNVTKEYRANIGTLFLESRVYMNEFCSMITKCVKEGICNKHDDLEMFYIEDIFIDDQCVDKQYALALKCLLDMNATNIRSLSIHVMQTINDGNIKRIMQQLNIRTICNLEKLYVWGNIPRVLLQSLLQLSKHTMRCLELWGMQLFSEDVSIISTMSNIRSLSFLSTPMTHVVLEKMMLHFEHRTQLSQVSLQDIECTDHSETCPGYSLQLSDKSRLSLLLLDKVNLARIHFNAEELRWCIVEWLPIPGALTSLLHCLKNATYLERFDCDGPASLEDTRELVAAVSTFETLEYLRLRHVQIDDLSIDFTKLQTVKRVHFCNVTMGSDVLKNVISQVMDLSAPVTVFMDNCKITPLEMYQKLKTQLRSSDKTEVLMEKEDGLECMYFKTIPSDNTLKNTSKTVPGTPEWEQCFCEDSATARQLANRLLKNHMLPDQCTLDKLFERFGRTDPLIHKICAEICVCIKNKSSKILHILPSYTTKDSCKNIVFVVLTDGSLSSAVLDEIEYTLKVRQMGEYSLEAKTVTFDPIFLDQCLTLKELENLKKCINKYATILMSKHKMLSIITPSPVRSKRYGFDDFLIEREPCIVLYVHTKNYVPIDEEPFQDYYDGIPIDVREGVFVTHPATPFSTEDTDVLKMGCQIGSEMSKNAGTLGGFIEHPQYGLCGFTCAHVLLPQMYMEALKRSGSINWPNFYPHETVNQPGNSNNGVGRLVQAVYTDGNDGQIGVEVALFQIETRHPNAGDFHAHDDVRFDSGKPHGFSRINNDPVVKFGCTTNKTVGQFVLNEPSICVKTISHTLDVGDCMLTLHNQLEVKSIEVQQNSEPRKFADFGDSGSLVLMKRRDRDGEYTCVGMVEGGTSYGTTIVTPITPVLEALNVTTLKSFETAKLSGELRDAKTEIKSELNTLESRVNQLDTTLQRFGNSIMQELRDLKSKMPSNPAGQPP